MAQVNETVIFPRTLPRRANAQTPGDQYRPGSVIPREQVLLVFETVRQLREMGKKTEAVRKLSTMDGTVSAAVFALVQTANSGFTVKAYESGTHNFSEQGTDLARSIIEAMNTLYDYTEGYADRRSLDSVLETGLREVVMTGGVAAELVLNKLRLPQQINLIPYEQLNWKLRSDKSKFPQQISTSGMIDLDIPTFWISESHKEANRAYTSSMMEAALNTAFYYSEFIEDMRRAVRRSGHARIVVTLDGEKVRAAAPQQIQSDPDKLRAFMEDTRDAIVKIIEALEPEDALVTYDTAKADAISADGEKMDYKELLLSLAGMLATSLKSHPSILGLRLAGSQSLSNTESLVYLKTARAVQLPLEEVMSRAITLSIRLYGFDAYVKFRFDPINLRPVDELEAFFTMYQTRILEQLSLGFITDQEAAEALGTGPRAPGAPPLSGTMFMAPTRINASNASPNQDPMGRALQPSTPAKGGGASQ